MLLVDTSVWIEVLRGRGRIRFHELIATDSIVTCLPVRQEVLQGFDDHMAFKFANDVFREIDVIEDPLSASVFDEAVALYRAARAAGDTVRSSVDCLIAACAIRAGAVVLHADRDFDKLARISTLKTRSLLPLT